MAVLPDDVRRLEFHLRVGGGGFSAADFYYKSHDGNFGATRMVDCGELFQLHVVKPILEAVRWPGADYTLRWSNLDSRDPPNFFNLTKIETGASLSSAKPWPPVLAVCFSKWGAGELPRRGRFFLSFIGAEYAAAGSAVRVNQLHPKLVAVVDALKRPLRELFNPDGSHRAWGFTPCIWSRKDQEATPIEGVAVFPRFAAVRRRRRTFGIGPAGGY